ncbi:MAG: hypothetical protein N2D54_11365, partial [Chloroflexota bacterium]
MKLSKRVLFITLIAVMLGTAVGASPSAARPVPAPLLANVNGGWSDLNGGLDVEEHSGGVYAVAVDSKNNLYIGGEFSSVNGVSANNIAMWNGSSWKALNTGTSDPVSVLAVDKNDDIYVGGWFTTAGAKTVNNIARWDSSAKTWNKLSGVGGTGTNGSVRAIVADDNGNVFIGGSFTHAGGGEMNRIARYNKSSDWHRLRDDPGNPIGVNDTVHALALDKQNNIYIGGAFTKAGAKTANRIVKWNGSEWKKLLGPSGNGITGSSLPWDPSVSAVAVDKKGDIYVAGAFLKAGGIAANSIAKWNGTRWAPLKGPKGDGVVMAFDVGINELAFDKQDKLFITGYFSNAGGISAKSAAMWHNGEWYSLKGASGQGLYEGAYPGGGSSVAVSSRNNVYFGGTFKYAGGVLAMRVAKWNNPLIFADGFEKGNLTSWDTKQGASLDEPLE